VHLKNLYFLAKSKNGIFAFFLRKTNSFRRPGGFCWPIGVTAALLGRLLPSDGHKLVKKIPKFRPKSATDRPLFFWTSPAILNLYVEQ
jgi:hypothetical protein